MKATPRVTIGIPVFHGEEFIAGAVESLKSQTFRDFTVIMSVDGGDEQSATICRSFEHDQRFRVVVQPTRLGFAGNFNWITRHIETEFFVYLGQDDHLDPTYIEMLVAEADRRPGALVVYCDLKWFGGVERIDSQPEIRGAAFDRVLAQLQRGDWLAVHGLVRAETLKLAGALVVDSPDNVFEDVIWQTRVLRHGTASHVARVLYFKRSHPDSVTLKQASWPPKRTRRAWLHTWSHLLEAALPAAENRRAVRRLLHVALGRIALRASEMSWFLDPARLNASERRELVIDFLDYVRHKGTIDLSSLMERDWEYIRRWSLQKTRGESAIRTRIRPAYRRLRQLWD